MTTNPHRTRVVRYWHKLDWLYKVEEYVQATGEEKWMSLSPPPGMPLLYGMPADDSTPQKGDWYWAYVEGALSRERAEQLAKHVAEGIQNVGCDVVAEYGS